MPILSSNNRITSTWRVSAADKHRTESLRLQKEVTKLKEMLDHQAKSHEQEIISIREQMTLRIPGIESTHQDFNLRLEQARNSFSHVVSIHLSVRDRAISEEGMRYTVKVASNYILICSYCYR